MKRVTTAAAREGFSALVNTVAYSGDSVVLTRRGRDLAMLCPLGGSTAGEPETDLMSAAETVTAYGGGPVSLRLSSQKTYVGSHTTIDESHTSLAGLFASPALVAVLRILLLHRNASFHQRELARLSGTGLRSVQAETRRLESMGLVVSVRSGNRRMYSIDWEHPAAGDLMRLFARSFAVSEVLRDALSAVGEGIVVAFVYGSIAQGSEVASSDIDVMVVGDVDGVRLSAALEDPERLLGRTINATVYPVQEFEAKVHGRNHFLSSVIEGPVIVVAGDLGSLRL